MPPTPADNAAVARLRNVLTEDGESLLGLLEQTESLMAENAVLRERIAALNQHAYYEEWFNRTFNTTLRTPNTWPFSTFAQGTPWSDKVVYGMQDAEFLFAGHLMEQLDADGIAGDVVEFGCYGGTWLEILAQIIEKRENGRLLWGFDSFEGLPEPDAEKDGGIWQAGQYAMGLEQVAINLRAADRPFLRLVQGWFNESLVREPATAITKIAYARIDGDLYASAVDCLNFLTDRLADGAILVFDDWQFSVNHGEVLAFREWTAAHPIFDFEFLGMNMWAHLYLRVRRRG